jgi:integrase
VAAVRQTIEGDDSHSSDDELVLFWRRVDDPPNSRGMGQELRLIALTGVCVTELAGAEIKEFERLDDAKNATWTIPAARSKNGKAHVVPLSGPALSIVVDLVKRATALAGEHSPPRLYSLPRTTRRSRSTVMHYQ